MQQGPKFTISKSVISHFSIEYNLVLKAVQIAAGAYLQRGGTFSIKN